MPSKVYVKNWSFETLYFVIIVLFPLHTVIDNGKTWDYVGEKTWTSQEKTDPPKTCPQPLEEWAPITELWDVKHTGGNLNVRDEHRWLQVQWCTSGTWGTRSSPSAGPQGLCHSGVPCLLRAMPSEQVVLGIPVRRGHGKKDPAPQRAMSCSARAPPALRLRGSGEKWPLWL